MQRITNITETPKQEMSVILDDGSVLILRLYYISSQIGWFFDIEYAGIRSNCRRLTNSPNIIRDKINVFPFGIGCTVTDGQEPWFVDDFSKGRVNLYILSKEDVVQVEKEVYGKIF